MPSSPLTKEQGATMIELLQRLVELEERRQPKLRKAGQEPGPIRQVDQERAMRFLRRRGLVSPEQGEKHGKSPR